MNQVGRREEKVMCVFKIIKKAATKLLLFYFVLKAGEIKRSVPAVLLVALLCSERLVVPVPVPSLFQLS